MYLPILAPRPEKHLIHWQPRKLSRIEIQLRGLIVLFSRPGSVRLNNAQLLIELATVLDQIEAGGVRLKPKYAKLAYFPQALDVTAPKEAQAEAIQELRRVLRSLESEAAKCKQ